MNTDGRRSMQGGQGIGAAASPVSPGRVHPRVAAADSRCRGLSLVELLMSLAITAMLLTATMVAIDASFKAYAAAAESASTQTATRMVINRLMTLVRTSTAHGPLLPDADPNWPVSFVSGSTDTLESLYLELIADDGRLVRIEYRPGASSETGELWLMTAPDADAPFDNEQPMLGGVTSARFFAHRRRDRAGVLVLDRGTIDLQVRADRDNTLAIEADRHPPIRFIASTMPRKLD